MRLIKFRAWDKREKEMCYNAQCTVDWEFYIVDKDQKQYVLMQFTGLKDKNGKEIYEGDIVSGKGIYESIRSNKFEVIYHGNKCSACFIFADKNGLGYHPYEIKAQEIIGNIYENPDLIVDTEANEYPEGCKKCCS